MVTSEHDGCGSPDANPLFIVDGHARAHWKDSIVVIIDAGQELSQLAELNLFAIMQIREAIMSAYRLSGCAWERLNDT